MKSTIRKFFNSHFITLCAMINFKIQKVSLTGIQSGMNWFHKIFWLFFLTAVVTKTVRQKCANSVFLIAKSNQLPNVVPNNQCLQISIVCLYLILSLMVWFLHKNLKQQHKMCRKNNPLMTNFVFQQFWNWQS